MTNETVFRQSSDPRHSEIGAILARLCDHEISIGKAEALIAAHHDSNGSQPIATATKDDRVIRAVAKLEGMRRVDLHRWPDTSTWQLLNPPLGIVIYGATAIEAIENYKEQKP